MNARTHDSDLSFCWKYGITIYPIPTSIGKYYIEINNNGKIQRGKKLFPKHTVVKSKTNEVIKGVYDRIRELYSDFAHKIEQRNKNNNPAFAKAKNPAP